MIKLIFRFFIFVILINILSCKTGQNESVNENSISPKALEAGFINPPIEARPRAFWDWIDGNVDKEMITYELEQAKAKGMGGFDIWDVSSLNVTPGVIEPGDAFMSDKSLDAIVHAIRVAKRIGIDLGLITASGWNDGGPWTKLEDQTMGLFASEISVTGDKKVTTKIPFVVLPDSFPKKKPNIFIPRNKDGMPKFYQEIAVLAFPENKTVCSESEIIDISQKMDKDGNLSWDAPAGNWKIVRYVCANTGMALISSSPNSAGPLIDHFNPRATEQHLNFFINKLKAKLGGTIQNSGLKYLYTDSYEVKGKLWSPIFVEEFKNRFGYDLLKFIPALNGLVIENKDITKRFLHDYSKLLSDLVSENHYRKAREICHANGLQYSAEAAGPGYPIHNCPFESLYSSGQLDFPRGEFWYRFENYEYINVLKGVASASHIYNQKYVDAEAFTSLYMWQDGPGDLKTTADNAFCEGLNRLYYHTFAHQPKKAGIPGYYYPFGQSFSVHNTWWEKSKPFNDYMARCSFMLQQGNFVGDLLFYYGDSAPNFVRSRKWHKNIIPQGYDFDYVNSDIIINKLAVTGNALTLPHSQQYRILVLPEMEGANLQVMKKIEQLIKDGAIIIGPKPTTSLGLSNWKKNEQEIKKIADKVWGKCDGKTIFENTYGKGKVIWGRKLETILNDLKIEKDFHVLASIPADSIQYIHRQTNSEDIYFITSTADVEASVEANFRISGMKPEIWKPENGEIVRNIIYHDNGKSTKVLVNMEKYGSCFVVFRKEKVEEHISEITRDGQTIFPMGSKPAYIPLTALYNDKSYLLVFTQNENFELKWSNGKSKKVEVKQNAETSINNDWKIFFPKNQFAPDSIELDFLKSYTEIGIDGVNLYSGTATYCKQIEINNNINLLKTSVLLDLGTVECVAEVFVNNQKMGILWKEPYIIDIGKALKPGQNKIKIEVVNQWNNGLIADAKRSKEKRLYKSNITRLPLAWAYPMETLPVKEYSEVWLALKYKEKDGILPAGILGPAKLIYCYHDVY
jgi:hypothetical protein